MYKKFEGKKKPLLEGCFKTIIYLLDFGITTAQVLDNIGHESEINHGGRLSQSTRCYIRHGPTDLFDNVLLAVIDLFLDDLKETLRKEFFI